MLLSLLLACLFMATSIHASDRKNPTNDDDYTKMPYEERAQYAINPVAQKLFKIMCDKKTNIISALDLESFEKILFLLSLIGPFICAVKLHTDTLTDFSFENITKLKELAQKGDFLIFEDRKFADIGKVVEQQYTNGTFKIVDWADLITAHAISGPGTIQALYNGAKSKNLENERGIVMLAQMSSVNNLADYSYATKVCAQVVNLSSEHQKFVAGIVTQNEVYLNNLSGLGILRMTPGIGLEINYIVGDQQYETPQQVFDKGTDIPIIGSAIYNSKNPAESTKVFQEICWNAYSKRIAQK
jgi:orotidine 5'-phosphate decarboxylase subfamily 1